MTSPHKQADQREMRPSLTRRPKMRTTKPAPMHCVLVTTVCWYASSVTAAPTHPIRNPLRFRSMLPPPPPPPPLLASALIALPLLASWMQLLRVVWTVDGRREEEEGGLGSKVNGFGADEGPRGVSLRRVRKAARGAASRLGKRRFRMSLHSSLPVLSCKTCLVVSLTTLFFSS